MSFKKNDKMEFIEIGEDEMTVFNSETGDTHFLDATGSVILSYLNDYTEIENLIDQLSAKYEAEPGEIKSDVEEFLFKLLEKRIVVCK